jgi:hypothetical protein
MEQLGIDSQEDSAPVMKCFGAACRGCKRFFECPEHWGDSDEE